MQTHIFPEIVSCKVKYFFHQNENTGREVPEPTGASFACRIFPICSTGRNIRLCTVLAAGRRIFGLCRYGHAGRKRGGLLGGPVAPAVSRFPGVRGDGSVWREIFGNEKRGKSPKTCRAQNGSDRQRTVPIGSDPPQGTVAATCPLRFWAFPRAFRSRTFY